MPQVLVLYCHPDHHNSRLNSTLLAAIQNMDGVTIHDLYTVYPHGFVDVQREQDLLLSHDVIVMQFPVYWYSTPPLLKSWQDDVLEHGFAHGAGGDRLAGKSLMLAVTAGGGPDDYHPSQGQFPLPELLRPLEATASLCQLVHRGIWHVGPSETQTRESMAGHAKAYRELMEKLVAGRLPEPFSTMHHVRITGASAAHPPLAQSPLPEPPKPAALADKKGVHDVA